MQREHPGDRMSVVGWFDGERFVPPFMHVLDEDGFVAVEARDSSAAIMELRRTSATLGAANFVGPFRMNLVLDREGIAVIGASATPDHTWPAASLLWEGDLGAQLKKFAKGELKRLDIRTDATAVTLDVRAGEPATAGLPLDKKLLAQPKKVFVGDVRADREGDPVLASEGLVARIGAVGPAVTNAWSTAVEAANKLWVPHHAIPGQRVRGALAFPKLPEPAPLAAARGAKDQSDSSSSAAPPAPFTN
jgi:hypothetical protein